jgi:hypothetical protein
MIGQLAEAWQAPSFEPHVTLYATASGENDDAEAILRSIDLDPLTLYPVRIGHSERFTQTLTLEFLEDAALQRLVEALRPVFQHASDYQLRPHLSLLYQQLAPDARERLAKGLEKLPWEPIRFDALRVVTVPDRIETVADVPGWTTVAERRLGSKP